MSAEKSSLSERDSQQRVPTGHVLTLRGTTLHYLAWGEATNPPLLLLHGGAAHAHWWDHVATVLARNFYVLALDLRGHGDSSWVHDRAAYQIEDYVADLVETVATLALPPFVLIGHSLGGLVAMSYASAHSSNLRSLVIVDIGPRIGSNRFMRLLRWMPSPVYANEEEVSARFRLLPEQTSASPELFRYIAWHSVRRQEDGSFTLKVDRATFGREPRDLRTQLPHIQCPTLILRGRESHNLSSETMAEMLRLCPHALGVEIAGAGHHIFLDTPQEFLVEVQRFLLGE